MHRTPFATRIATVGAAMLLAVALPMGLHAQPDAVAAPLADDPVVQRLDDLAALPWIKHSPFTTDTARLNVHGFAPGHVPAWSESEYLHRLQVLDAATPFDLTYNKVVQSFIDLYAVRKREMTSRMLGLAELYFPVFEEALDRHGIPLEMKYLAVVESALNPSARSRAGAVGLWQFMLPTGKMYGLDVDSYVDERHDVYLSTDAACKYLKYLHGLYNDWEMAMAAYNCGPGNVNKAIRRSGGSRDYWAIYDHLPRETRGYVPAFIAVNYIFNHYADHNIYPVAPVYCAYEVDTVQVCYPLDLNTVARHTGTSPEEVRALNPVFKQGLVPDVHQPVTIYLPKEAAGVFVANEETLKYSREHIKAPAPVALSAATPMAKEAPGGAAKYHTVRKGESLGSISKRYGLAVSKLKQMNGLRSDMIKPGQRLKVGNAPARAEQPKPALKEADGEYIYHVVQPGDTLWDIAKKYPGITVDDLHRLNSDLKNTGLQPGHRIKVGTS